VGVQELKPWMAQPKDDSVAAQAGLRSGDEIVAVLAQTDAGEADGDWQAVQSMTDLQWHFTQTALHGQDLRLRVRHRNDQATSLSGERELLLPLKQIPASEVDGQLFERLGLTGPYAPPLIDQVIDGGAAKRAGLQHGDRVLTVNGKAPVDAGQLRQMIRASQVDGVAQTLALQVERAGQTLSLSLTPVMKEVQGQRVPRIDAALGAEPATVMVSYGAVEGLRLAVVKTWDVSALSLGMLGKMLVGQASVKNLSGPLTIADYAGRSAQLGWVYYLGFLAMVSVSLGILNLLPLPVLDGGHLMYYLFEGVTGRPVSERWLERLQRGGVAIMLMMMSLAFYNDLARLWAAH